MNQVGLSCNELATDAVLFLEHASTRLACIYIYMCVPEGGFISVVFLNNSLFYSALFILCHIFSFKVASLQFWFLSCRPSDEKHPTVKADGTVDNLAQAVDIILSQRRR